eukprot:CAMPEP_0118648866 /NCGR_PEP_ID=MMETSP0785-20121206/9393_1 /TAXON_ID=91992 /ORGANISM="Bolidomonas pacifica, Strain CCMP 1866" /LENGTH=1682 /DNA_ID=CAMNT_0006541105 /DNA_START=151 /DNA_END=5195 /DNA_ORIENTATION=+
MEELDRPPSPVSDFSDDTDDDTSLPDEDYLASRLSISSSLLPWKRHQQLLAEANSIEKMFSEKDGKVRAAMECEAVFESEKKRLGELKISQEEASSKFDLIRKQVEDEPLGLHALPKDLVDALRVSEKQAMIASELLRAQNKTVAREERVYLHAQHEANVAEASVEKFADIVGDLRKVSEMEVAKRKKQVERNKKNEVVSAKRLENRQRDRVKEYNRKLQESNNLAESQKNTARELHKTSSKRITVTSRITNGSKKFMEEARLAGHENRIQVALELKANTDAISAALKGKNERNAILQRKKEQAEREEFGTILKMGGNPYVEFKRRDVKKKAAKDEAREHERIKKQEAELADRMVKDDEYNRKKEEHLKRQKEYEDAYRGEQGREIIEARNRAYLMEKTTNNTDLIDPTRRIFNIEPSQVTTIKDASFGLGYNPRKDEGQLQAVIDMVKKKYPKVGPGEYSRLIPKKVALDDDTGEEANSVGLDGLLEPKSLPPGQDALSIMNKTGLEEVQLDEMSLTTAGAASGVSSRATTPGTAEVATRAFPKPQLTKFEKDALQKAQARQKTRLLSGTPQIAGGREFKGQAFVAKPDTILFKDFVLGKFYKRRILLTNVSLTFNSFKILDLPETVTDFFEISYERPGRMSAGMSVLLEITFMPKVNEDIITELSFLSSTGPFSIPLHCLTQTVAPKLNTNVVRFDNIVMGERVTFRLKVMNNGAKSTMFYFHDAATGKRIAPSEALTAATVAAAAAGSTTPGESEAAGLKSRSPSSPEGEQETKEDDIVEYLKTEEDLLAQAAAVGEACLEYPAGLSELQYSTVGSVGSYTETYHDITFAPLSPGRFKEERVLHFDHTEETIKLTIVATSIKVPIYVAEPVVDMKCCVYDKLYRKNVVVKNRGKISFKIFAKPPLELQDFVEFNPDMGFIQPDVDFEMKMKFRPSKDILAKCGKYAIPGKEVIAVPILVQVPEMALPVYYTLFARLTTGEVTFNNNVIDHGNCFISQSSMQVVKMKNNGRLPMRFGFVNLPKEVEVQPNDGFGALMPQEEKDVCIIVKPSSAVYRDLSLTVQTTMNLSSSIRIKYQGLETPLKFDHTVLKFASCCPGDKITHSVFATNTTKTSQTFEFAVPRPSQSFLRITPNVETIGPGATCRFEIEYCPPSSLLSSQEDGQAGDIDVTANDQGEPDNTEGDGKTEIEEEKKTGTEEDNMREPAAGLESDTLGSLKFFEGEVKKSYREDINEPWSVHSRWSLPCFVQGSSSDVPPIFIDVHTTLVKRILDIDTAHLDFGQLAVGQTKVLPLRVRNYGAVQAPLIPSGLNSTGPFCVVNAIRDVPPNDFQLLSLQFAPLAQGVRSEILTLSCPTLGKTLTITLKGKGVSPVLIVSPPGTTGVTCTGTAASITKIDQWATDASGKGDNLCKHVLAGDVGKSVLTLCNSSVFPLRYNLQTLGVVHENFNSKDCYDISPPEGQIDPGEEKNLEVVFQPDHERIWSYKFESKIEVPNQVEEHVVRLVGRCWNTQMYCVGAGGSGGGEDEEERVLEEMENRFKLPVKLKGVEEVASSEVGVQDPKREDIVLKFPKDDDTIEKGIVVGSIALNDPKMGSNGTFEIVLDKESPSAAFFAATPDKGSVSPGQEVQVTFKFTPPPKPGQDGSDSGSIEVGQWTKVLANVICKGGYKPEGAPDERVFKV